MKRLTVVILSILLLLLSAVPALAAGTVAVISAEDAALSNNTILVPVSISNNPGIMGFKVTASYPSELLEISSVTAGNVTSKGSFIHNAGKTTGQVDIIWYSTEQAMENGSLFVLTVKPTGSFTSGETTQISLSYSQADTFNEQYEDVAFDCKPINVYYGDQNSKNTAGDETTQGSSAEIVLTDDQIIDAVDVVLDNSDITSIDEIDNETLTEVNNNIITIAGPNAPQFNTVEDLRVQYKAARINEYKAQVDINMDPSKTSEGLNGILNNRNADSFSNLNDKDKKEAVSEAYKILQELDDTLPGMDDCLSDDESAIMFDEIINEIESNNQTQLETKNNNNGLLFIIIIVISLIVVAGIIVYFVLIKKRSQKMDND